MHDGTRWVQVARRRRKKLNLNTVHYSGRQPIPRSEINDSMSSHSPSPVFCLAVSLLIH
jgi:hypothetical protein